MIPEARKVKREPRSRLIAAFSRGKERRYFQRQWRTRKIRAHLLRAWCAEVDVEINETRLLVRAMEKQMAAMNERLRPTP